MTILNRKRSLLQMIPTSMNKDSTYSLKAMILEERKPVNALNRFKNGEKKISHFRSQTESNRFS